MKTITLRGIDEELEKALRTVARETGSRSLNATVLHVLRESLGLTKRRRHDVHHDLDHLAGTWSDAERKEFEEATALLGRVDKDLWE